MAEKQTLVLDETDTVIRIGLGRLADIPLDEGQRAIARTGNAAAVHVGWRREDDGSWTPPYPILPPEPVPEA